MFNNADEVLQFIGDNKVEFVDVRFSDLLGTVQHFTVPTETFDDKVFTEGRMFDGSSIRDSSRSTSRTCCSCPTRPAP